MQYDNATKHIEALFVHVGFIIYMLFMILACVAWNTTVDNLWYIQCIDRQYTDDILQKV